MLGALALTLVVFAGAPEHLITGSALLALAFGWTMLAVLSIHLTSQPQRWALVPAALMAVTGLGLLAFTPGNGVLTTAGYVPMPAALDNAVVNTVWSTLGARPPGPRHAAELGSLSTTSS